MNLHSQPSVRLRAMEPEDIDFLYQIENDPALWDVGSTNVPYSRFALHEYMSSVTNDIYTDKQLRMIVETPERQVVGIVDLVNYDPRHQRAEIGIVIRHDERRNGYASAAIARLLVYSREVLHLHQIYAIVSEQNSPALALFENLHFEKTGILHQWLCKSDDNYVSAVLLQYFFAKKQV